ncbi:type IIL restriction-modification enzyme MmeI [Selenomonas sp.]|uniref:type IIL restriction-modification enzyme MmeI n=1 Tax=Selenomonas sp. TaxID=2053611 RepID=UPI002A74A673|nr:type IIL restriction-modification enzyme MmeI [Selenomonas sp.]MDY3297780.1 type IIL restriction-modification enzyme MmeI [Selenomonas sp.]
MHRSISRESFLSRDSSSSCARHSAIKSVGSSLADLYDDVFMPKDLREAHRANDRAVLRAYGLPVTITESDCVAELMRCYEALAAQ